MATSNYYDKLVMFETPYMSNTMTDTNHLRSYLYELEPQKIDSLMTTLFTQRQDFDTPLLSDLEMDPKRLMLLNGATDSWSWDFEKPLVPAVVVENMEVGNNTPGIDKLTFNLKLDRDWFTYGDVITADRFSGKQVRVVPDGINRQSDGWVYTVQLVTDDATEYYPAQYMDEGTEYIKLFSIYGEYNDQGTKVIHAGKMKMMNSLAGEIRTDLAITDWADALVINVATVSVDANGKPVQMKDNRWFKKEEALAWQQQARMKENYITFGQKSSNLASPSAYDVSTSMGLWQMLHLGNVHYYNSLSLSTLIEPISDMYYGRIAAEKRNVTLYTGEAGFLLFSEAVMKNVNGLGGLIPLDKFIDGSGMNMSFGYQFKSYKMPNGGVLNLKHMKTLDQWNTKSERGAGKFSRMSATFIGLDMSQDSTENVRIVKRSTRADDYWGYIPGTASPYGPLKGGMSASKKAGYDMWIYSRLGLHIEDITKTFILKPTFEF